MRQGVPCGVAWLRAGDTTRMAATSCVAGGVTLMAAFRSMLPLAGLPCVDADTVPAGQLPTSSLYEFCLTPSSGGGGSSWRAWRLDLPAYEPPADGLFRRI